MTPSSQSGEQSFVLDKASAATKLEGHSASLDEALTKASDLLRSARFPVVISGGDLATVNAALDLAEAVEAGFDVADSAASLKELKALQDYGGYLTSKREAIARADLVLAVGSKAAAESERFFSVQRPLAQTPRTFLTLPSTEQTAPQDLKIELASLAALASPNPPPSLDDHRFHDARQIVEKLKAARFGVAVWSPAELHSLDIAALMALVDVLNAETRFTALPLRDRSWGATQLCLSRWGIFPPTRWLNRRALPLPPGQDIQNMIQEADLLVSLSSERNLSPLPHKPSVPSIVIGPAAAQMPVATVSIEAGEAGRDFSAIYYDPEADTYTAVPAENASGKPPAYRLIRELLIRVSAR